MLVVNVKSNSTNIYAILIYCNFLIKMLNHKMSRPFIIKVFLLGYFPYIYLIT